MGPRGGGGGCVHGSYSTCMGPTVRAWVLQGWWYHTPPPPPPPNHTQLDHLPVHHLPVPPPARQCMGKCALQECRVGVLYMECIVGVLYMECRVGVLYIECF